jgi:putative transposase
MTKKFRGKYRIDSVRLQRWDYASNGAYFITMCTQNRVHYFGQIKEGKMHLSVLGQLAEQYWLEIVDRFPFVRLGNFVVMPDHMHGILMIEKPEEQLVPIPYDPAPRGGCTGNKNPMLHKNIATMIRWYKGRCSFEMRKHHAGFEWQASFYDRIIRSGRQFRNVQRYIKNNPAKWHKEKLAKDQT